MSNKQSVNEFLLSYREVIPDQTSAQTWKEISLNTGMCEPKLRLWLSNSESFYVSFGTGATQNSLQDIKVAERAGGFHYSEANAANRNRFIYW